jgi:hypothetical protein
LHRSNYPNTFYGKTTIRIRSAILIGADVLFCAKILSVFENNSGNMNVLMNQIPLDPPFLKGDQGGFPSNKVSILLHSGRPTKRMTMSREAAGGWSLITFKPETVNFIL